MVQQGARLEPRLVCIENGVTLLKQLHLMLQHWIKRGHPSSDWQKMVAMRHGMLRVLDGECEADQALAKQLLDRLDPGPLLPEGRAIALETLRAFGLQVVERPVANPLVQLAWAAVANNHQGATSTFTGNAAERRLAEVLRQGADPFEMQGDGHSLVSYLVKTGPRLLCALFNRTHEWPQLLVMPHVRVVDSQGRTLPQLLKQLLRRGSSRGSSNPIYRQSVVQLLGRSHALFEESHVLLSQWLRSALTNDVADIAMQYFAGVKCKAIDATAAADAEADQSSPASSSQQ